MAEAPDESGENEASDVVVRRRRHPWLRFTKWFVIGLLVLIAVAVAFVWIQRRPIASNVIDSELAKRGVEASYTLDRIGLRTQQISNLVIGDPDNPDLTAEKALVQIRIRWDGSVEIYRIVARGVRLRGKVLPSGKVSWGQIDKLLPPPSGQPFSLPDIAVDVADTSISLQTPWGPLGVALRGSGNLTGGFTGQFVSSIPRLQTGSCFAESVRGAAKIEIVARKPHVAGPLTAERFACPSSRFAVVQPRLEIDSRFGEAFESFDARARIISQVITAGDNGLGALNGSITFVGDPSEARGKIDIAAQRSRLGTIFAERTRLQGEYVLGVQKGTLVMNGRYAANGATLDPSMIAGFTNALSATKGTPIGPVATAMSNAISRSASSFDVSGKLRLANFPGGGGARVEDAEIRTVTGGRATMSGGKGVTFYWPSGRLRFDGTIRMAGGGLPTGVLVLNQTEDGGMTGVGQFEPYTAAGSTLGLGTVRFQAEPSGATTFSTAVQLTGPFDDGVVRDLRLPVSGRLGENGSVQVGPSCITVSFDYLRMQQLQLGPTSIPVCPTGPAIITRTAAGDLRVNARIARPSISGRLGDSRLQLDASDLRFSANDFTGQDVALRLGREGAPIAIDAGTLTGTFAGSGISGRISNGQAVVAEVPMRMTEIDGRWKFYQGNLSVDGNMMVEDRADLPRFYPLRSDNVRFRMTDNQIRATGTLRHPESGTEVADVTIEHNLEASSGEANFQVPGLTFGPDLQPEELTRLTEGVVALVRGTVTGQGRIAWDSAGEVTSTGEFSTVDADLAAPFGPVEGLTTKIRFTDLLNLETAPGQIATVDLINPGIPVQDGVIRYQLLPNQLVKIERGVWPFMGGQLILHETILNFGTNAPKRLTFELIGFDANLFVESLGFEGLEMTGIFDGVLPMIFDDDGGRIVGGRLESRPPGGRLQYTGTKPDAGLVAGVAFDLLSDVRFRSMIVRIDGDLAGEFATRFTINRVSLGNEGGFIAGLIRGAFDDLPLKVNLNISGPFRALIEMAKGFEDPVPVIDEVVPIPLDAPGIVTESRTLRKEEDQERVTPLDEVEVSSEPPPPSETE